MLRLITDGKISPEEAVRAYHGILQGKNIKPKLPLERDLELTDQAMSYSARAGARTTGCTPHAELRALQSESPAWSVLGNGSPDFEKMDAAQRHAYDRERLARKFR